MQPEFPIVVAEWPRNSREMVRVTLNEYRGHPTLDCRCWFSDEDGGFLPGRCGITLAIRHLPRLVQALREAEATARALGLVADQ